MIARQEGSQEAEDKGVATRGSHKGHEKRRDDVVTNGRKRAGKGKGAKGGWEGKGLKKKKRDGHKRMPGKVVRSRRDYVG